MQKIKRQLEDLCRGMPDDTLMVALPMIAEVVSAELFARSTRSGATPDLREEAKRIDAVLADYRRARRIACRTTPQAELPAHG